MLGLPPEEGEQAGVPEVFSAEKAENWIAAAPRGRNAGRMKKHCWSRAHRNNIRQGM